MMRIMYLAIVAWAIGNPVLPAQDRQPKTREEAIEQARRDKMARLWPERESPLADQVNQLVERGLLDGFESGKGANGWQIVLGGMVPARA